MLPCIGLRKMQTVRINLLPKIATLTFTDPSGRTMKTLRGDFAAGRHELDFKKGELPAGVLFYKIESAGRSQVRKMAVMD